MRGELKGDGEKDKTDRLRERRKKKAAQRTRHREKERAAKAVDKANPGLGNKHAKIQALQRLQKAEKEGAVSIVSGTRATLFAEQAHCIRLTIRICNSDQGRRPAEGAQVVERVLQAAPGGRGGRRGGGQAREDQGQSQADHRLPIETVKTKRGCRLLTSNSFDTESEYRQRAAQAIVPPTSPSRGAIQRALGRACSNRFEMLEREMTWRHSFRTERRERR